MNIGWIGFHVEGIPALHALLDRGVSVNAVISLSPAQAARRSGKADYRRLCRRFGVRLYEVDSINDFTSMDLLRRLDLDVVFVIGWTQILRREVLSLARIGMIGAHASLLPANRGRAPINWALIHGVATTGNTLFWLDPAVDAGDVIDQVEIPITPYDTCATLYRAVAAANRQMILKVLPELMAGRRPGRAQGPLINPLLPGRRPEDGVINWAQPNTDVYNFIRALTRPYPGAFTTSRHGRLTVWQAALIPGTARGNPGEVIGPVVSPLPQACGQLVACDRGAVLLLEVEAADGRVITGRELSDQHWCGQMFGVGTTESMTETV
jgi:methionyl-tRNA formyltransferase